MDEPTPTRRPRGRPRTLSDDEIFEAALSLFAERGFDGVSMRELNRRLGVSPAMLARRFATKEALWEAVVVDAFVTQHDTLRAAALDVIVAIDDDLDRFEALVATFIELAGERPELQRVINHEACQDTARTDFLYQRAVAPLMAEIRPLVDELTASGLLTPVTDRELFFLIANGAASVHALAPLSQCFDAPDGPLDPAAYAARAAHVIVAGMRSTSHGTSASSSR